MGVEEHQYIPGGGPSSGQPGSDQARAGFQPDQLHQLPARVEEPLNVPLQLTAQLNWNTGKRGLATERQWQRRLAAQAHWNDSHPYLILAEGECFCIILFLIY